MYNEAKAEHVIKFIEKTCCVPEGNEECGIRTGDPVKLMDWQKDFIRKVYGTVNEKGRREIREAFLCIPRKNGKALHINTKIPTPFGFKKMGELKVGDMVYAGDGTPTKITGATDVMHKESYIVKFSDGTQLTACGEHLWEIGCVNTGRKNGDTSEDPTKLIRDTNWIRSNLKKKSGHGTMIPNCYITNEHRIDNKPADLPIDPYVFGCWLGDGVFGCWLGDGTSSRNMLTCAEQEMVDEINKTEHKLTKSSSGKYAWIFNKAIKGTQNVLLEKLRSLGVLNNKHIPEAYLNASYSQRLALLQGLMDTDGHVSKKGQVSLGFTNRRLADDAFILVRSLGIIANHKKANVSYIYDKPCNFHTEFYLTTTSETPVFRLKRKLERLRKDVKFTKAHRIYITDIIPCGIQPVKCIAVDHPDHTYLAGEQYIKTHNTVFLGCLALYHLIAAGRKNSDIYCFASSLNQSRLLFQSAVKIIRVSPILKSIKSLKVYKNAIEYKAAGNTYQCKPATPNSLQGLNPAVALCDELHVWEDQELYNVIATAQNAQSEPLLMSITTAGTNKSGLCYNMVEYSRKLAAGTLKNPYFYGVVYGMDDDENWEDEAVWRKCNPSIGHTFSIERLRQLYLKAKSVASEAASFRRYYLNHWAGDKTVQLLDVADWRACGDPKLTLDMLKEMTCYLGVDPSARNDLTAIVALFVGEGKYYVIPFFFLPSDNIATLSELHKKDYQAWVDEGWLMLTQGEKINHEYISDFIINTFSGFNIEVVSLDIKFQGEPVSQALREKDFPVMDEEKTGGWAYSEPTKKLERLVTEKRLVHNNNPIMEWMAECSYFEEGTLGDIRLCKKRKNNRYKIDGITALVQALSYVKTEANVERWTVADLEGL